MNKSTNNFGTTSLQAIDLAINEANKSYLKVRVGAVIMYRNKIISQGHNYTKHGYIRKNDCPL